MTGPAIEVTGVHKAYGTQTVLDGIDLRVEPGSVFALLGPNGAGKTTLITILSTLVQPDAGTVTVAGHDLATDADGIRRAISVTGQAAAVDGVLTGEENLRMMARLSGFSAAEAQRRAAELIDRFDLADAARKRVATYSGGMRRRLDLALSLVATPPVIFLDEPTTGLDTRSRQTLWDMIQRPRAPRHDHPAHHAVPRGGRPARRPHRGARPRRHRRRGHRRRAEGAGRGRGRRAPRCARRDRPRAADRRQRGRASRRHRPSSTRSASPTAPSASASRRSTTRSSP